MEIVDIWNLGLGNLGDSARVASTSDTSTQAVLCRRFYTQAFDVLYTSEPWPFTAEQALEGQLNVASPTVPGLVSFPSAGNPAFIQALAWLLSSMLAGPILKGDVGAAEAKRCTGLFQYWKGQALLFEARRQPADEATEASSVAARY